MRGDGHNRPTDRTVIGLQSEGGVEVVGDRERYRPTIEREKGFEPSTSTLARCFPARDSSGFAQLKVHEGAARSTSVVGIGGEGIRALGGYEAFGFAYATFISRE